MTKGYKAIQNKFYFIRSLQNMQVVLISCLLIPLPITPCSPLSYSWNGLMLVTLHASSLATTSCL